MMMMSQKSINGDYDENLVVFVGEMNEAEKGNFKDMPEAENPAVNGLVNPDPLLELLAPNVPLSDQINIDTNLLVSDVVDDDELNANHVKHIDTTVKSPGEDITLIVAPKGVS